MRPIDRQLLGFEPHPDDPSVLSFVVTPHLCRTDGRFYGGAALAASLAASEEATGRDALWSSTQLIGTAELGERIRVDVDIVASGRHVDQTQVHGTVGDRLVFSAVGSAATPQPEGLTGVAHTMPAVPPPDDCEVWTGPGESRMLELSVGHHLVSEHRHVSMPDEAEHPGHLGLWSRLAGDLITEPRELTATVLGFLADMVPLAVTKACGVEGAGTSLDNSLRLGPPTDGEWVLLELQADFAVGGYGHGVVLVWSTDGKLLAAGSQSARLFSLSDFFTRQKSKNPST